MSEVTGSKSWREELASVVEDSGIIYTSDGIGIWNQSVEIQRSQFAVVGGGGESAEGESESFKEQVKGFLKAWGEMLLELGKGCRDIVQQNVVTEDSYIVQKLRGPLGKVSRRLSYLNEFLPEDRHPVHAWLVVFTVLIIALAVLSVNTKHDSSILPVKRVYIHPASASHVLLPNGRHMAYQEQGVPADRARFSLIASHTFLSSRLAGIPRVKGSLLEEFGVRLVTYDLPGFGESDPHPSRNLSSSALDMLFLANAVGIIDKFWVLGYSSGGMHAWAALRYIPDRIAGAALFAPMVNPYEPSMTKDERYRTWEKWVPRRKLMYILARRFPKFLSYFYRRSFLSGKHGRIEKWLSLSLGKKDEALIGEPIFEEFWHRDVEESIRQGNVKPFIEEAVLQGMDDQVVPPSMTDYVGRVLPGAFLHKLPNEGHFSYLFFCDECHRQIFSTLFGTPQGPLNRPVEMDQTEFEGNAEEVSTLTDSTTK
ncbi:hypothetical protein L1049_007924 [Liquidambar formosana]|uniref:AB hydrolase-1 domain-containing protein n=1 Tax=Liquidambar formosana TaxID=63359 RepID=A0AAP0X8T1_LIQFO